MSDDSDLDLTIPIGRKRGMKGRVETKKVLWGDTGWMVAGRRRAACHPSREGKNKGGGMGSRG